MNQLPPNKSQNSAEPKVESELQKLGKLLDEFFANIAI